MIVDLSFGEAHADLRDFLVSKGRQLIESHPDDFRVVGQQLDSVYTDDAIEAARVAEKAEHRSQSLGQPTLGSTPPRQTHIRTPRRPLPYDFVSRWYGGAVRLALCNFIGRNHIDAPGRALGRNVAPTERAEAARRGLMLALLASDPSAAEYLGEFTRMGKQPWRTTSGRGSEVNDRFAVYYLRAREVLSLLQESLVILGGLTPEDAGPLAEIAYDIDPTKESPLGTCCITSKTSMANDSAPAATSFTGAVGSLGSEHPDLLRVLNAINTEAFNLQLVERVASDRERMAEARRRSRSALGLAGLASEIDSEPDPGAALIPHVVRHSEVMLSYLALAVEALDRGDALALEQVQAGTGFMTPVGLRHAINELESHYRVVASTICFPQVTQAQAVAKVREVLENVRRAERQLRAAIQEEVARRKRATAAQCDSAAETAPKGEVHGEERAKRGGSSKSLTKWERASKRMIRLYEQGKLPSTVRKASELLVADGFGYNTVLTAARKSVTLRAHFGLKPEPGASGKEVLEELVEVSDAGTVAALEGMSPLERDATEKQLRRMPASDVAAIMNVLRADPDAGSTGDEYAIDPGQDDDDPPDASDCSD